MVCNGTVGFFTVLHWTHWTWFGRAFALHAVVMRVVRYADRCVPRLIPHAYSKHRCILVHFVCVVSSIHVFPLGQRFCLFACIRTRIFVPALHFAFCRSARLTYLFATRSRCWCWCRYRSVLPVIARWLRSSRSPHRLLSWITMLDSLDTGFPHPAGPVAQHRQILRSPFCAFCFAVYSAFTFHTPAVCVIKLPGFASLRCGFLR